VWALESAPVNLRRPRRSKKAAVQRPASDCDLMNLLRLDYWPGFFLAGGAFAFGAGSWGHFTPFAARRAGAPPLLEALGLGLIGAFYSFGGFWEASRVAGEMRDPRRQLPRALGLGVTVVTAIYVLTTLAFLYLVPADKAREIYTSIVRRTQDPGLLEYMGNNLLRMRVFPVPARGDQKISISYTSIAASDNGLVEFLYPLKADARAATTLKEFSLKVNLKSQHPLQNIYSPTHAITMTRPNDKEAVIGFDS
jgi:hypothetical protein